MSELLYSLPPLPNGAQYFFKRSPSGGWEVHRPDGSGNGQKLDQPNTMQNLPARATSDRKFLNKEERQAQFERLNRQAQQIVEGRRASLAAVTYGSAQADSVRSELNKTNDTTKTINERNRAAYGLK